LQEREKKVDKTPPETQEETLAQAQARDTRQTGTEHEHDTSTEVGGRDNDGEKRQRDRAGRGVFPGGCIEFGFNETENGDCKNCDDK